MKLIDKDALVAEIERRINEINLDTIEDWRYRLQREHDIEVMKNILSLIDTLEVKEVQEEPVSSIWHDTSEPPIIDKTFLLVAPNGNSSLCLWGGKELHSVTIGGGHSVLCKGDIYSYIDDLLNLDNSCNFEKNLQEEPVSEDFEEALAMEWQGYNDRGAATVDALEDNTQELAFAKGFYRGAKWQKEKEYTCYEEAFEDGAKWQKEHMMIKAINAHCFGFQGAALFSFRLPADNYLVGSEVKVIVIKED